ncbi:MAG: hypothetical protein ABI318_10215 [Chthoniobacteraceae bacterium]
MKHILLFLFLTAHALFAGTPGIYPNSRLTPGVVAPVTQAEVLRVGFTQDARHVTDKTKWEFRPARNQSTERAASFLSRPFRALSVFHLVSQGVALGWNDSHRWCSEAHALNVHDTLCAHLSTEAEVCKI